MLQFLASLTTPPDGFHPPGVEIFDFTEKCLIGSGEYCLTKITALMLLSMVLIVAFLTVAFRRAQLVPESTLQRYAEGVVDIVRKGVVLEVMGPDGLKYMPLLFSLFIFIWVNNFFGILPFAQIPTTSRIAIPMSLALLVWVVFNVEGIRKQGGWHYFKNYLWPPAVPTSKNPIIWVLWTLVRLLMALIELVSVFLVRPLTLAVRLAANMIAGHLILTIFAVGTYYLLSHLWTEGADWVAAFGIFSFALQIFMTGFEVLVAFLQAYIFTMLTAVYIAESAHPDH
jgi:F-type H+-transporting ATPase subunit a